MNPEMTKVLQATSIPFAPFLSLNPRKISGRPKATLSEVWRAGRLLQDLMGSFLHSSSSVAGNRQELEAPSVSKAQKEPTTDVLTPSEGVSLPLILALKL